jgi:transcriptional regulator with XRE-family HTH domain
LDGFRFGRGITALRRRRRWRQQDLADASRVSASVIARIEQGRAGKVTIETLDRVAAALDARVSCRLTWNGEELDRLLDAAQAAVVEQVVRRLAAEGWVAATEVSFNEYGERGSIDVLGFHPATRCLLVVEVKSVIPDVQATLMTLDRKVRLAPRIARPRGWTVESVGWLLAVRDDRTSRRRIEEHAAIFGTTFPHRIAHVRRWLARPVPDAPLRGLWFLPTDRQPGMKAGHRSAAPSVARPRNIDSGSREGRVSGMDTSVTA